MPDPGSLKSPDSGLRNPEDLLETVAQSIIRDLAAPVVQMMEADVRGHPVQQIRQVIVRASVRRGDVEVSAPVICPVGVLEVALNVGQPNPRRRGDQEHRDVA
jgi:hypothetical protein